jgi:hypothetical protein
MASYQCCFNSNDTRQSYGALVKRCKCAGTHRPAVVPLRTAQGGPSGGKFDIVNWFTEHLPHLV